MECPVCHTQNEEGFAFCENCGAPLPQDNPQEEPVNTEPYIEPEPDYDQEPKPVEEQYQTYQQPDQTNPAPAAKQEMNKNVLIAGVFLFQMMKGNSSTVADLTTANQTVEVEETPAITLDDLDSSVIDEIKNGSSSTSDSSSKTKSKAEDKEPEPVEELTLLESVNPPDFPQGEKWDGVTGYQTGTYINDYRMNKRKSPTTNADSDGLVDYLSSFVIEDLIKGENNSVWGRTANGYWLCLQDPKYLYCFGPGGYKLTANLDVYSTMNGSTIGTLDKGDEVYIEMVQKSGETIWGLLWSGDYIKLSQSQSNFVTRM